MFFVLSTTFLLFSTQATGQATGQATATNRIDDHIMNIYHHIHHMEVSRGTHPDDSVLLDLTRHRLSKHLGIDYADLQLGGTPQEQVGEQVDDPTAINQLEKLDVPVSKGELYGIHPSLQVADRSNLRAINNIEEDQEQQTTTAQKFQVSKEGGEGGELAAALAPMAETKLSRAVANELFGIDEDYTEPEPKSSSSNNGDECQELCNCMASELLFGITKTLPYLPGGATIDAAMSTGTTDQDAVEGSFTAAQSR